MPTPAETRLSNSRARTTATLMLPVAAGAGATSHGVPDTAGVTESLAQDSLIAQFNEVDSISIHFDEYPDSIACVIVEPVTGNMGVVPPEDGFWKDLERSQPGAACC